MMPSKVGKEVETKEVSREDSELDGHVPDAYQWKIRRFRICSCREENINQETSAPHLCRLVV